MPRLWDLDELDRRILLSAVPTSSAERAERR